MTKITFSLIRSQNPEIETADDIQEIRSLRLIQCEIDEIENLELFHHIDELYLAYNNIHTLTELSIFFQLKILDISFNNISSSSLRQAISSLPKSLISINLTGNPCVEDEESLLELQDALPEAIIAIDFENEEIKSKLQVNREIKDEGEGKENEPSNADSSSQATNLDSENVLREIVERKCRIQNATSTFNLENTVKELNGELEQFIDSVNKKRQERVKSKGLEVKEDDYFIPSFTERKRELIERSHQQQQSYDYRAALNKIRTNAHRRLQEIKIDHELNLQSPLKGNPLVSE